MSGFKCVGYDIRYIHQKIMSADLMLWDRDDDFYTEIIEQLELTQNILQLLNLSKEDYFNLSNVLEKREDLCLISIHIPSDIYELYLVDDEDLIDIYTGKQFNTVAYDICDIDGFFSFFDMQKHIIKSDFDNMDFTSQLSLVQFANFKIKAHSPFCLVKIEQL